MAGLKRTMYLCGLLALVLSTCSWFQGGVKKESEVKAAYLYTFLKYMECPGSNSEPIVIAVVGKNPFEGELKKYIGKEVRGRKIKILYFDPEKEKYDKDHNGWLKFSLTFSTILILLYFVFPSQLTEVVARINII